MLVAEVELGEQFKKFLNTKVGRYIEGCTQQDIDVAKDELLAIDPYKYNTLVELQNAIRSIQEKAVCLQKLRAYMADAIVRGDNAGHVLAQAEDG